jgi:cyclic 2,3-diphosphoglycerate synthetase
VVRGAAIVLIDGEHHPSVVRDAVRGVQPVGAIWCGGEEKVPASVLADPEPHYGIAFDPAESKGAALERLAAHADRVVDLADEPILDAPRKLRLAALALHLGLAYEAPGLRLDPPLYETIDFEGKTLAVIGTGKRTGKTAAACHLAALLRHRGASPAIVSMGRGGPPQPALASPDTSLEQLEAIAAEGRHAASDYLEDAVVAHVPTVGTRRVGGGLTGQPHETNMVAGTRLAASIDGVDTLILEGSGACVPPVVAHKTICIVGNPRDALGELGPYRLLRADLVLAMREAPEELAEIARAPVLRCHMIPEPAEPLPKDARVAFFSTGPGEPEGIEPVIISRNLAHRDALERDLDAAMAEGCDVYLTELKAAAIDTVAARAHHENVRVVFVRNRVVSQDADLDETLVKLWSEA